MAEPCSLLRDNNGTAVREIPVSARRMCKRIKTRRLGLMDLAGNFIRRQHRPQSHSMRCYDDPQSLRREGAALYICSSKVLTEDNIMSTQRLSDTGR